MTKYIVGWTIPPSSYGAATERFLTTGGPPPAGVNVIGRWHGANARGVAICSTSDAKALYAWLAGWADVLNVEATPCLDDAEAAEVLQAMRK